MHSSGLKKMQTIKVDNPEKINTSLFNWIFPDDEKIRTRSANLSYPPAVWKNNDQIYKLNYFNISSNKHFLLDTDSFADVLNFSMDFYNAENANIMELANLTDLVLKFGYQTDDFDLFKTKSVKGNQKINTLIKIRTLPYQIRKYLAYKNPSFKILNIIAKLNESLINIAESFIVKKNPSLSEFRSFVTKLFDFKYDIAKGINEYDEEYFGQLFYTKNTVYNEFIEKLNPLLNREKNIFIENMDNFETDTLQVSFSINSPEDYQYILEKLLRNRNTIHEIYRLLEDYDLR